MKNYSFKKHKRLFCLFFLFAFLLVFLVSCGETTIVGTWEMTKCVVGGVPMEQINPCEFIFSDDGTGEKKISGETEFTFSYSYDGSSCILYNLVYGDGTTDAGVMGEITIHGKTMTVTAYEDGVSEEITLRRK